MTSLDLASQLQLPHLTIYLKQVERELDKTIDTNNPSIANPIKRLINTSGKRLRPALVIAAAGQNGKIDTDVIRGCAAVELVHIASLVHDDIIDNSIVRWNTSTINSREGVNHAILIGDYLFAKAYEQAATISQEVAVVIATAITALCDGQSRELTDKYNAGRSIDSLLASISGKTASLLAASCEIGGLCAGLNATQVAALGRFGHEFGMSFQLIDDLLDLLSNSKLMGKPVGNDIAEGVYTLPLLYGLQGPNSKYIRSKLAPKPSSRPIKVDMLIKDGSINKTIIEVKKYNQSAADALKKFKQTKVIGGLLKLPSAYTDWALQNLVAKSYQSAVSPAI